MIDTVRGLVAGGQEREPDRGAIPRDGKLSVRSARNGGLLTWCA